MSQEIEIEFKQLLTEEQYTQLMKNYKNKRSQTVTQTNYYFDTKNMDLKAQKSALRVRYKNEKYVLTLKQPRETGHGLLETHQQMTPAQWETFNTTGALTEGPVYSQLAACLGIPLPELTSLGCLTTERSEIQLEEGLLVLDKSSYLDKTDYELEFECTDYEEGETFFMNLLYDLNMEWNSPANKIERFYKTKISGH